MSATPSIPVKARDLTRAFENGDLLLHYQPQVDVSRRWPKIVGYEALSRWPQPDGSFVPPDRFIPVAEDCGLALILDTWVIDTVCKELARVKATGASRRLGMAANVSPQQFGQRHFAQSVDDILTRTGVDPTCLTLEITERAVLDENETTLKNIYALREIGVSLALDDFGTGYSSLFHLRTLPIQEVKLDRSFVSGLPHRHRDAAIMSAPINLASELSLRVVAEGVELAQQAEWLQMNGCSLIQGFLYGRPAARI
ncbi:EAL domain-containing protein [Sediminimonas sp.]|uniref:EAL domain-containing protein n=1 Tax=Sediminimonas sp. TaxID=2823379 RepID=UPI0025DB7E59|nr:EAL domain-containing protein [Sediminimonas sp.]